MKTEYEVIDGCKTAPMRAKDWFMVVSRSRGSDTWFAGGMLFDDQEDADLNFRSYAADDVEEVRVIRITLPVPALHSPSEQSA